ncbi:hypothetical protein [Evansella tamaricis]|uniref:Lipoprotein n=1 Tax=Evansella tamaricis TaxID=2069301 RepID=A0ABS6JIR7_9BACI|nr:hypothetical protein [Evansella tamaricis]MBU9713560.1 hypothetical protein [Evansella tamaricis]
MVELKKFRKTKYCLMILILFLFACHIQENGELEEVLYYHTGKLITIVDQRNEPVNKMDGITYTLTMDEFNPTEPVFNEYIATFPDDYEGFGYIDLSERTKIYIKSQNKKTLISPSELSSYSQPAGDSTTNYQKLGVWITPHNKWGSSIEAVEVEILID